VNEFLQKLGFLEDPFESTNAEFEKNLGAYFVPPPYFPTIMGDPENPSSHFVFAPRGGGKTAQRRMIENRSRDSDDFLCITYDTFDQPPGFSLDNASWAYHVNQVCRLILAGILLRIDERSIRAEYLPEHHRGLLKFQMDRFLGSMSVEEFRAATSALKNLGDKVQDFWRKYGGPLNLIVSAIMSKAGIDAASVPSGLSEDAKRDETLRYHFEQLLQIAQEVEYKSTYVLVDRVDEISATAADATKTLQFIELLATDLPTLEAPGVAFKFFLWDQVEEGFRAAGARADRIPIYRLVWSVEELARMLAQRLLAYSDGRISSFNELICVDVGLDVHAMVAHFAAGSPRDMIRLCSRIVAEQTRTSVEGNCVGEDALWQGLREFSNERAGELLPGSFVSELRRVGKPTFTISHLASDVFRVKDQAARRKVQLWTNTGMVAKVGEIPNPPNRPLYLFGVTDIRLAVAVLPSADVPMILGNYVLVCPSCGHLNFSDRREIECLRCHTQFELTDAKSFLDDCRIGA